MRTPSRRLLALAYSYGMLWPLYSLQTVGSHARNRLYGSTCQQPITIFRVATWAIFCTEQKVERVQSSTLIIEAVLRQSYATWQVP